MALLGLSQFNMPFFDHLIALLTANCTLYFSASILLTVDNNEVSSENIAVVKFSLMIQKYKF